MGHSRYSKSKAQLYMRLLSKTYWFSHDDEILEITEMEPNHLYIAALEVIRKNYNDKEEWLAVFYEELKKKGRPDLVTKLMLRNG